MMKLSIGAFLIGLVIYQGLIWKHNLDTDAGQHGSRNVFITFLVGAGVCVLFYLYTFQLKFYENDLLLSAKKFLDAVHPISPDQVSEPAQSIEMTNQRIHSLHVDHRGMAVEDLSIALRAAVQAHMQCAEAERRLASEYDLAWQAGASAEHISSSSRN